MNNLIPKDVFNFIKIFKKIDKNTEIYLVGGAVRDLVLKNRIKDFDFATNIAAEKIISYFKDSEDIKVIPTGLKHGTVTLLYKNVGYEVTTYRIDGIYTNGRCPDNVSFTLDFKEDLSRRDFTCNAMGFDFDSGIYDIFNSMEDIKNRTIRAVGNPLDRLSEDYLRALRAIRFASKLDFLIDDKLSQAISLSRHRIENISTERITKELNEILLSDNPKYLNLLIEILFDRFNLSYIDNPSDLSKQLSSASKDLELRWAIFMSNQQRSVESLVPAFSLSNSNLKNIINICKFSKKIYDNSSNIDRYLVKKFLYDIQDNSGHLFSLILEHNKLVYKNEQLYNKLKDILLDIFIKKEPFLLSHLCIDGEDLKQLNLIGKQIGEAKLFALDVVMKDFSLNEKHLLLEKLKRNS